jgi:hypothetical protein
MFSLDNFYSILNENLLLKSKIRQYVYFSPFGSTSLSDLKISQDSNFDLLDVDIFKHNTCIFFDQEPLSANIINDWQLSRNIIIFFDKPYVNKFFANSEISELKKNFCKDYNLYDWYYFFHGFAALDWFRDYQYIPPKFETSFDKVFISLNHLITKKRSYRLNFVARLMDKNIINCGIVSLPLSDYNGTIKQEVFDKNSKLDVDSKKVIATHLFKLSEPLVADTSHINGTFSANLNLSTIQRALWTIVTETIYYDEKLHLTEKIFKPIVACRPFILVGAYGNLAYLKRYGFKTFDRWIDESYDDEKDPHLRMEKIILEIEKLCSLSMTELKTMEKEMREVLEYNFNHFYGKFKEIIVNELVDNFHSCVCMSSNGAIHETRTIRDGVDYEKVKKLLLS